MTFDSILNNINPPNITINTPPTQIGRHIYVLGVHHFQPAEYFHIEDQIARLRPDMIMIELDENYYEMLQDFYNDGLSSMKGIREFYETQPNQDAFNDMAYIAGVVGKISGMMPGQEFMAALEIAKAFQIPYRLIDHYDLQLISEMKAHPLRKVQDPQIMDIFDQIAAFSEVEGEPIFDRIKQELFSEILPPFETPQLGNNDNDPNFAYIEKFIHHRITHMKDEIIKYFVTHPSHKIMVIMGTENEAELSRQIKERLMV
jgi:hypothetical protein